MLRSSLLLTAVAWYAAATVIRRDDAPSVPPSAGVAMTGTMTTIDLKDFALDGSRDVASAITLVTYLSSCAAVAGRATTDRDSRFSLIRRSRGRQSTTRRLQRAAADALPVRSRHGRARLPLLQSARRTGSAQASAVDRSIQRGRRSRALHHSEAGHLVRTRHRPQRQ